MGAGSYTKGVAAIHRQLQTALRKAKSRQAVMNAYWKHKRDSERLLTKHLKEEFNEINKIKNKIPYK